MKTWTDLGDVISDGCTSIPKTHPRYAEVLAAGDQVVTPEPAPVVPAQEMRVILARLTNAETSAIFGSADPLVIKFRNMALAVGAVRQDDPDAQAGFAYLVSQGLLAASRPAELLAP
jgi:hypothetical protein